MAQDCTGTIKPQRATDRRETAGALALLRTWTVRSARCILAWHERARERRMLLELDDHMLKDIGLTRKSIETEARKPFWRE